MKDDDPTIVADITRQALNVYFGIELGERWPVVRSGQRAPIPTEVRRLVWHRDGGRCQLCGTGRKRLQLDHIVPWSAGGPDTSDNLRLLCGPCNKTRSNFRTVDDSPAVPVTRGCDDCIRRWVRNHGHTHFGRVIPGNPEVPVFCGNCMAPSVATDPARLL